MKKRLIKILKFFARNFETNRISVFHSSILNFTADIMKSMPFFFGKLFVFSLKQRRLKSSRKKKSSDVSNKFSSSSKDSVFTIFSIFTSFFSLRIFSFDKNDFRIVFQRTDLEMTFFFLTLFARYDNINCEHLSNNSIIRKGPPEPCGGLKHL